MKSKDVLSVSAILLTYNCDAFVAEALRSVLWQECDSPMEILVSDDASTDDTVRIVREGLSGYDGPHRATLHQRSTNSGSKSAHLNDIFGKASGDVLISFDGDDISEPSRVRKIVEQFRDRPHVQAVYSSFSVIDNLGRSRGAGTAPHPPSLGNTRAWFAQVDAYAAGTTLAVRREVVEKFPALDPQIHEDIVLPFRASLLGEVEYIPEPLVRARRHAASLTADMEQFASLEDYRRRMRVGIERARRNVRGRLADLRTAEALMPDRAEELRALERIVHDSLAGAEMTEPLVSPSIVVRLSALLRLMRAGAYRAELFQHACLALIPGTFLRYKRRTLGVKRRDTASRRP